MIHSYADGVEGRRGQHRFGRPTRMTECGQAALKEVVLRTRTATARCLGASWTCADWRRSVSA